MWKKREQPDRHIENIKNSLQIAFQSRVVKYLVGTFGSVVILLLFGHNFLQISILNSIFLGLLTLIVITLFIFTIDIFKKRLKRNLYGEYIIALNEIAREINTAVYANTITETSFNEILKNCCNNLKILFDLKIKGRFCSVSIKVPIDESEIKSSDTIVKNLCRDDYNLNRDTEDYKRRKHFIFNNSCYNVITANWTERKIEDLYYINNNIPKSRPTYQNSSGEGITYNSEIVVPIIPIGDFNKVNISGLLGFLCVDCVKKNAFSYKYDFVLLQCIASNIYDIMLLKNSLLKK